MTNNKLPLWSALPVLIFIVGSVYGLADQIKQESSRSHLGCKWDFSSGYDSVDTGDNKYLYWVHSRKIPPKGISIYTSENSDILEKVSQYPDILRVDEKVFIKGLPMYKVTDYDPNGISVSAWYVLHPKVGYAVFAGQEIDEIETIIISCVN